MWRVQQWEAELIVGIEIRKFIFFFFALSTTTPQIRDIHKIQGISLSTKFQGENMSWLQEFHIALSPDLLPDWSGYRKSEVN